MIDYSYTELIQRIQHITGIDPYELIERVRILHDEYGTLKAKVEYMQDFRKAKLYAIVEELRAYYAEKEEKVSEARLESQARACQEYKEYLQYAYDVKVQYVKADSQYYAARNQMSFLEKMIDYARSEQYHIEKK